MQKAGSKSRSITMSVFLYMYLYLSTSNQLFIIKLHHSDVVLLSTGFCDATRLKVLSESSLDP